MSTQSHERTAAALQQLHRAIDLFLDERDYLSALTLAGAADGVFGEWLEEERGLQAAVNHMAEIVALMQRKLSGEPFTAEDARTDLNWVRNWLKHYWPASDPSSFDARSWAHDMIERAIDNYLDLTKRGETDQMIRFRENST